MPVAADQELRLPHDGAFQNGIIVWVGNDDFQCAWNRDDFGEGAHLVGDFRRFARLEAAFDLKFLGEFSENRFARQRQAIALAGRLNTLMRIPQPADGGKENVRVEDDAGNIIHDS